MILVKNIRNEKKLGWGHKFRNEEWKSHSHKKWKWKWKNKCYNALKFVSNVKICIFCYLASSQLRPTW